MKKYYILIFLLIPVISNGQYDSISLYNQCFWKVRKYNNQLKKKEISYNSNNDIVTQIDYKYDYSDSNHIVLFDSLYWYTSFLSNNIDYANYGSYFTEIRKYDFESNKIILYEASKIGFIQDETAINFFNDTLFYIYGTHEELAISKDTIVYCKYRLCKSSLSGKIYKTLFIVNEYENTGSHYISNVVLPNYITPLYIDNIGDTTRLYWIYEDTIVNVTRLSIHSYVENLLVKICNYKISAQDLSYPGFMKGKYDEYIVEYQYDSR